MNYYSIPLKNVYVFSVFFLLAGGGGGQGLGNSINITIVKEGEGWRDDSSTLIKKVKRRRVELG